MSPKKRVDQLLVEKGLCDTVDEARRAVLAGTVRIGADHVVAKASDPVKTDADLRVETPCPYVSRGAYKLAEAFEKHLPVVPPGTVALDVGASTGGFTDFMLQKGVAKVFAVDVGYGQLHYKLRQDPRVVCIERLNARYISEKEIPEKVDILTADLSFISLRKVIPACAPLLKPDAWAFLLVKPQFEARRHEVDTGGVVRDEQVRQRCIAEIVNFARTELNWQNLDVLPSPIKGPAGNQEFIAVFH